MKVLKYIFATVAVLAVAFMFLTIGGMESFMFGFETGLTRLAAGFVVAFVSIIFAKLL